MKFEIRVPQLFFVLFEKKSTFSCLPPPQQSGCFHT
jgi:hypothetical protein